MRSIVSMISSWKLDLPSNSKATMQPFIPQMIYIDQRVVNSKLTERVLRHFPNTPHEIVTELETLRRPEPMTQAKKKLLITRYDGQALKACQGMGDYVCCNYLTISLVSNCHLECSYCILQDYLKNNPIITFFANVDEILDQVQAVTSRHPEKFYRIGTGELSDSLALDPITGFSESLVSFAARQKNVLIELKTKSNQVDQLLELDHDGKTVISWSVNPPAYIAEEEHKCSSLNQRLEAAQKCVAAGYKVGFHMDPLMAFPDWQSSYSQLIEIISEHVKPENMAWISLGSLRFTPGLKNIATERFPKSRLYTGELYPSADGKTRYLRSIRQELYQFVREKIETHFPKVPHYLCMETNDVWDKSYGFIPQNRQELEQRLTARFGV